MLKNYIKTAIRSILKNKAVSAINIFGLSVSMSVCLLIISIIAQQFKVDRFHEKGDRIYRVVTRDLDDSGPFNSKASSPKVISDHILNDYTYLDNATKLRRTGYEKYEVFSNFKFLQLKTLFADEHFFEVFDFELKEGNKQTALKEPYSVIISNETGEKFFGDQSPLNQTIEITDLGIFKITGVLEKTSNKSHLESDCYISMSSEQPLQNDKKLHKRENEWNDTWSGYNYLLVKEGANLAGLEQDIIKLTRSKQTFEEKERQGYSYYLQNIKDITPGPLLGNPLNFALPSIALYFLAFLAFIVLLAACFNYTNLSIARSLTRAKEIGIRKVSGSSRTQIFLQLISESVIISLLSLLLAFAIYKVLLSGFNNLWVLNQIGIKYQDDNTIFFSFILFSLFTGVLAGIIPAMHISKFSPLEALKDKISLKNRNSQKKWAINISLKKVLMVIQFSFSLIFIITVVLLSKQTNLIVNADYGFDKENIFNVELQGLDEELLATEFSRHPSVQGYSLSSHSPAIAEDWAPKFKKDLNEQGLTIYSFAVDQNYIENMDLSLIAGRNFPIDASIDKEQFLIINEEAVDQLEYQNPQDAIGQTLFRNDSVRLQIIGVVKDYIFQPMVQELNPMVLRYKPKSFEFLNLKLSSNDMQQTKSELEDIWHVIDGKRDFRAKFLVEEMETGYAFFDDLIKILKFISLLVITISCLGMLGMAAFNAQTRVKEIGIRKVLGANMVDLVVLISKSFLIMLTVAIVIATPLAYILNSLWLNEMANRVELGPGIIIGSILTLLVLGISAVASQTIGVARRNPVDSLRSE